MSKFLRINWLDVKSALVSGVIMALVVVISEILVVGDIFSLDWMLLANTAVIAFLTVIVSFLKSLLTTKEGMIAGVKIK